MEVVLFDFVNTLILISIYKCDIAQKLVWVLKKGCHIHFLLVGFFAVLWLRNHVICASWYSEYSEQGCDRGVKKAIVRVLISDDLLKSKALWVRSSPWAPNIDIDIVT
jgi:hypothetical protein